MAGPRRIDFACHRLPLVAWEWHDHAAPPLVLVHGGRDHGRSWEAIAAAFPDRHVVAPDLRGHGDSGWPPDAAYAMADFVTDLVALLDTLGIARCDLVGHSLGGNIAWRMAAAFPERVARLCVIEGLGPAEPDRPAAERLRAGVESRLRPPSGRRIYPDLAAAAARMREANPRLGEALSLRLAEHGTHPAEHGLVFKHDPALRAMAASDLAKEERHALWRAIAAPVLLVHGGESWASNPARDGRAAHFRNVRCRSFEGAGHWVQHDRTEAFVAELRAFLAEAGPA